MKTLLLTAALLVGLASPAAAVAVVMPAFSCTPETFSLRKTENGYRLQGQLPTPTPGYAYAISALEDAPDGGLAATLTLAAPEGAMIQVIDTLEISHDFSATADFSRLSLRIDKTFNWGPGEISCQKAEAAP